MSLSKAFLRVKQNELLCQISYSDRSKINMSALHFMQLMSKVNPKNAFDKKTGRHMGRKSFAAAP